MVYDDEKLKERVEFIHSKTDSHAIAEQFIEGRELYVGVMGNGRLQSFTPWELLIQKLPEGSLNIATSRLKWNARYQKKVGLVTQAADLTPGTSQKAGEAFQAHLSAAQLERLRPPGLPADPDGEFYLLEANPNPQIAHNEDFADSAEHSGLSYEELLQKIITLGLSYDPTKHLII